MLHTTTLVLPAIFDAVAAVTLKSNLLQHYYTGRALVLDASAVARIGRSELTLLWSAAETFEKAGIDLFIDAPSPAFVSALKDAAV